MKQKLVLIGSVIIFVLWGGLTACSLVDGRGGLPTAVPTAIAATLVAPTAVLTPTVTQTATVPTTTPTATPTATTVPATAVPATATTTSGGNTACTDAATFVTDVTVPDNSPVAAGTGFIKTWRVRNSGTCTWDGRYTLFHVGGDRLGAISGSFPLPAVVAPGQTIDLSVSFVAPAAAGSYRSDWQLSNPQGGRFGVGRSNSPVWAKIVVNPTSGGRSSLSGYAWQDRDQDNQVDANELLSGVTITLSTTPECRTTLASMNTDVNGRFYFANLAAGSYCLTGTDGVVSVGQAALSLGENENLTDIQVVWPPIRPDASTVAGLVYQDTNNNGSRDAGEPPAVNAEVWLIAAACQVSAAPQMTTFTATDGVFTFKGELSGAYCVGLRGANGLDDAVAVTVSPGQVIDTVQLRVVTATGAISGWLWNDFCTYTPGSDGQPILTGNCVPDGFGGFRADGMIQPTESYIGGVTMRLHAGACSSGAMTVDEWVVTGVDGRYNFTGLAGGTFCVFMNAAENGNAAILLPGDWTFPAPGIWYQEITMLPGDHAQPVNFGWDYQLQ